MNITEFLEARIAEDGAALERTGPYPHSTHGSDVVGTYRADCPDCIGVPSRARVLAECAAKRAILAALPGSRAQRGTTGNSILEALAAVYNDHPDYQQEWAL